MIKVRTLKLIIFAYFLPLTMSLALLTLDMFFSYPPFKTEVWLMLLLFSMPMLILALALLPRKRQNLNDHSVNLGPDLSPFFSSRALALFSTISIIYCLFMLYRYLIIGSVLTHGITGARYAEIASGPGVGGIFTGVTTLTAAAPVFLTLAMIERLSLKIQVAKIFWVIAAFGMFVSFLSGGRNTFLINLVFLYMCSQLWPTLSIKTALQGRSVRKLMLRSFLLTALLVAFIYSLYMFIERGLLRDADLVVLAQITASASGLDFDPSNIPSWMSDEIYFALNSIHSYLTVGWFYYDHLLDKALVNGHLHGSYNFFVFFLIIERLTGIPLVANFSTDLPLNGAYYTLSGSLFVDFGMAGMLVASVLLLTSTCLLTNQALKGHNRTLPMAALGLTVFAMAPLYNASALGSGPSILTISFAFLIFGKRSKHTLNKSSQKKPDRLLYD